MPRFMMLMIPNISDDQWASGPSPDDVEQMSKYNEELTKAGALLALDGLHPAEKGARVRGGSGGTKSVTDGPFAEAKEFVGGYWVIQAGSKEEAVEWAKRCPLGEGDVIEVRQVYEMSDFSEDVQAVDQSGVRPAAQ